MQTKNRFFFQIAIFCIKLSALLGGFLSLLHNFLLAFHGLLNFLFHGENILKELIKGINPQGRALDRKEFASLTLYRGGATGY